MDVYNNMKGFETALRGAGLSRALPDRSEALLLAHATDSGALIDIASGLRDAGHRNLVTYSRKVFIPLTHLCRDVCHYCTFAQTPKHLESPYLTIEQVLEVAHRGAALGCKEALFTLGEKPELRYRAARESLQEMGYSSTLDYLCEAARQVYQETGLLPHLNPGNMTASEIEMLRPLAPSMGAMLESSSLRLTEKGMPHYGSPDKHPDARLATIEEAGKARVPFTTGILIGIGETRRERIESLLALRDLHIAYGHLQEIIIQNFRAKPGTKMFGAPEPDLDDLLWTIAAARIHEHPGATEPESGRAHATPVRGHQRLGWRVALDAGFREPRSAVATPR
jgi:FO synthase